MNLISTLLFFENALFDFSPDAAEWLRKHDWYPDRRTEVPSWIPSDHPAYSILESFGDLAILRHDEEFPDDPITDIEFQALEQNDATANTWSRLLHSTVIGIGRGHNQHENVYVDTEGRIFADSLMHDAFYLRGLSLPEFLHNFVTGAHAKPMLHPDQPSILLYGEEFMQDSPEIFRYSEER